jgi:hypothetical protein
MLLLNYDNAIEKQTKNAPRIVKRVLNIGFSIICALRIRTATKLALFRTLIPESKRSAIALAKADRGRRGQPYFVRQLTDFEGQADVL